ncbi:hypothetical protein OR1_02816 [Geobacter sp. OR-1]|uniref:ArnT family glycosyltransferase n=1 Tax=Geobacter sp. OR-1 TaxID=1266765 RepID=UPI0005442B6E|nr:glycosyltransferase family 39 protein [Geobacter sp. OR-1]GAM10527.1 hypothetical protein OR1_02816 [Geobacter sp. OR-1]
MSIIKIKVLVVSMLIIFFIQSFLSLNSKSATFDEVQYFGIGKYIMLTQKWDIMGAILHPPLSYYLNSIPLLFVEEDKAIWSYEEKERNLDFLGAVDYYRGQNLLSMAENKNDRLLILSRLTVTILSLVLGYYVFLFAGTLFGEMSGVVALGLYTFCPNMLAFSGICVPDMPLTVFCFIFSYYYWLSLKYRSTKNTLLAGVFLGLSLLTKFTAIAILPISGIATLIYSYKYKEKRVVSWCWVALIGILILFIGYGFNITPYIQGNEYRASQLELGQSSFLAGNYSNKGWWYYYIIAFLLKTPSPDLDPASSCNFAHNKKISRKDV